MIRSASYLSPSILTRLMSSALFAAVVLPAAFAPRAADGATIYWDGTSTDWSTVASWSTSVNSPTPNPGAVPGAADVANFSISTVLGTPQTVNLNANQAALGLIFLGTNTSTTTLLGGGTDRILSLGTSGITVSAPAGAVTIGSTAPGQNVALSLMGSQSFTNDSASPLAIQNGVSLGVAGAQTLILSGANNAASTIVGDITNGSGTLALSKTGIGTWTLAGDNTFTGGVSLTAGILNINNVSALGAASGTFLINGGTIDNTTGVAITTNSHPLSINGNFSFTGGVGTTHDLNLGTGAATLGISAGTSRTINTDGGTLTIGGVIANGTTANSLVKTGVGTLLLGGANTYTGLTTVSAGTLAYGISNVISSGGVTVNGATAVLSMGTFSDTVGAVTIDNGGIVTGTGTLTSTANFDLRNGSVGVVLAGAGMGVNKTTTGTLTLSGANTFTAGVTLTAGTLNINNAAALGTTAGTFVISGGTTINNTSGAAITTGNYLVTLNGDFAFTGGAGTSRDLNLGTGAKTLGTAAGTSRTITSNQGTLTLGGAIANGTTANSLVKSGAGALALTGANTFTGGVTLNAGTLIINSAAALGMVAGPFVINGGAINNTTAATVTTNNYPMTINGDFSYIGGAATPRDLNLGTGAKTLGTAPGTSRTITSNQGTLTLGGVIANGTTANSLVKSGVGALSLTGANTFTGGVTLNAGTLNINNASALGTAAGTFVINGGTIDNTTGVAITTNSHPLTINGDFSFIGGTGTTHDLNLGTGAATLGTAAGTGRTITTNAGTLTVGGALADGTTANSLVKAGSGTVVLGGTNVYTGTTTVNAGTLRLSYAPNDTSKLADGAALVLGGGSVDLSGGSHTETVASTTLTAGTASAVTRGGGTAVLQLNAITPGAGAFLRLGAGGIASTDNLNTNGILGYWATVGNDWASNQIDAADGLIVPLAAYTDINRLGGVVPNAATANVRIIEAGAAGNITLAGGVLTEINTLNMAASGGAGMIDPGINTDVLRIGDETGGGVLVGSTAGALTIGTASGDGVLTTGGAANATPATLRLINESTTSLLTVNSIIADNGTDAVSVLKSGAGVLVLGGTNTYSGTTTVSAGTLAYGLHNAIDSGAITVTGATAVLDMGAFSDTVGAVILDNGGTITGAGSLTSTTTFDVRSGVVSAPLGGTAGLTKTTNGTVLLSGVNSYTGLTTVSAGTLAYGINNALSADGVTVDGPTAVLNIATFTDTVDVVTLKSGGRIIGTTGVLTSNAPFDLRGGSVSAILAGGVALNKTTSDTVTLSGVNTYTGLTTVSAGTLAYGVSNAIAAGGVTVDGPTAVLDIGAFTDSVGSVILNDGGRIAGTGVLTSSAVFDFRGGSVSAILAGTLGLNKSTTGTVTLSGVNTYTGLTTISAGTLAYGVTDALANGAITVDGSTSVLNIGSFNDTVGTVILANGASITGTTGVLTSTATFDIRSGLVSAGLGGAAPGIGLTKTTTGTVILSGASTYQGVTTLTAGTLTVAAPETPGVSGPLGNSAAANPGSIVLGGGTLQYSSANQNDYSGRFSTAVSQVYNVDTNNQNVTWATPLTSSGGTLTKTGQGILTLSGTNTYGGLTTVSAGTLAYGANNAISTGGVTVSGATAALNMGTFSDSVGTVILDAGGSITGTTGVLTSTATFDVRSGSASAILSGTLGLTKTSTGKVTLSGASTYTGTTTLSAGILNVGSVETAGVSGPFGNSAAVNAGSIVLGGGTLQYSAANQNDYSGRFSTAASQAYNVDTNGQNVTWAAALTSSGGTLVKTGAGTLTLTGTNTYSGGTTVTAGTLKLDYTSNNTTKLSDTAILTLAGGTLDLAAGSHVEVVASTTLAAGTTSTVTRSSVNSSIEMNTITRGAGAFVKFNAENIATTNNTNTNGILGGWATVTSGGVTGWAVNSTNGADGLITALASYTDVPRLGGIIPNTPAANVRIIAGGAAGDITLAASPLTEINSLNMSTNAGTATVSYLTASDILRIGGTSGGGILQGPSASSLTIGLVGTEGVLTTGGTPDSTSATLSILNENAANALIINSVIGNNGTDVVSLAKGGAGVLTLNGANTYTGVTSLSAGTINLASAEIVGTSGPLGASVAANAGSIILGGGTLQYSIANQNDYSGRFSTAANQAYNVDTNGQNVTWATALTSVGGSVTKSGTGALSLSGANTFTGGVTLNAGTLNINRATALGATTGDFVINGGAIDNTSGLAITNTSNNILTINGDFTFIGGRGTTHDLNLGQGATTLGTAAGTSRTITTNEGTLTLSGAIANGTTATSIIKAGAGALTLSGPNTFTGGVTLNVNGGILNLNSPGALGSGGTFTIAGGTIDNTSGAALTLNNNPVTVSGNFAFSGGAGTTHDLNLGTGAVALGAAVRTITTDAGMLTLGGTVGGGSAAALVKAGAGILSLAGASNTFIGSTAVNAGTLRLDYSTNNDTKLWNSAALILGGGTVELFGGSHTESVGSTTLTAGTTSSITRTSGTSVLEMNVITPAAGAFVKFAAGSIATTDNANVNGMLGPWATITSGGITDWAKGTTDPANDNDAIIALTDTDYNKIPRLGPTSVIPNTATDNVRIDNGGTSGDITLAAATTTINSLNMRANEGAATINLASTRVLSIGTDAGGGILQGLGAGALTIGATPGDGFLTTGGTANTTPAALNFIIESPANAVTVNSIITNNGTDVVSVAKAGVGTLVLSGTNIYTGTTTVSQGILRAGDAAGGKAFGTNSNVTLSSAPGALLDLNGFNQTIGSLAGGGGTGGNVTLGTGTLTTGNTTATTFAGVITGSGGVTKLGTGIWTLTGGNGYTGATTITGGRIEVGAAATTEVLSDRTAVTVNNLTQFNLLGGNKRETIGSLAGGTLATAIVGLGVNGALTTGGNNTSTSFGGVISGTGTSSVTKVGTGTMTLTNVNTFAGTLNINGGGVTLSNANTIANTTAIRLNQAGTTLTVSSLGETIGGISTVPGSTIALASAGTLTVTPLVAAGSALTTTTVANSRAVVVSSTSALYEGMLVNGAGISGGTRIAQILGATTILLDQPATSSGTNSVSYTGSDVIAGAITGTGTAGVTKAGLGELRVTGNFSQTGTFTVNDGPLAGATSTNNSILLIGTTMNPGNVLSDSATLAVGTTASGARSIDFVQNATNLAGFERIGGLSGGNSNYTLNLLNGASVTVLAVGGNNANTLWNGIIAGDNAGAWVMKEGTGTLTIRNAQTNDGVWHIDNGKITANSTGVNIGNRIDDASLVWANNRTQVGASLQFDTTETIAGLIGGGHGADRTFSLNGAPTGFLSGNYIGGTGGNTILSSALTVNNNTAANTYVYGGVLSDDGFGFGGLIKEGASTMELLGANTYGGITTITASTTGTTTSTLRLGIYGAASGLGPVGTGGQGSLPATTDLTINAGAVTQDALFDLNGASQTVNTLTGDASGVAYVDLGGGALTITTALGGSSGYFKGSIIGRGDVNVTQTQSASGWGLLGSNTFLGNLNVSGTGTLVRLNNVSGQALADDSGVSIGSGAQVLLVSSETIGTLSGAGLVTMFDDKVLTVAYGGSGAVSAVPFSGNMSSTGTAQGEFRLAGGGLTLGGNSTLIASTIGGSNAEPGGKATLIVDYTTATDIVPAAWSLGGATVFLKGTSTADTTNTTLYAGSSMVAAYPLVTAQIKLGTLTRNVGSTLNVVGSAATTAAPGGFIGGYATYSAIPGYRAETWAVSNGAGTPISGLPLGSYSAAWSAGNHYDATASASVGGTTQTVRFNDPAAVTLTLTGASTVSSGGILVTPNVGVNTSKFTGGGSLTSSTSDLIIHQYNPVGELEIDVPVTGGGAVGLTTAGQGTVILSRDNSFAGQVTIGTGRLQVGNGGTTGDLGTGGAMLVNNGVLAANRSDGLTISRSIVGPGWVRQEGVGTLTLSSGTSTYSGRTSVADGKTLVVAVSAIASGNQSGGLGSAEGFTSVGAGGTLILGGGNTSLDLAETIVLKGASLQDNTTVGALQTNTTGAVILLGENNTISTMAATDIFSIQGRVLGSPDTSSAAGKLPANVVIGGSGITSFNNPGNWYFGTTTINSGASLSLGSNIAGGINTAGSIGTGAVIDDGTLITNTSAGFFRLANDISGSGGFVQSRNTVYLTGDNTYTGTTVIGSTTQNAVVRVGDETFKGSLGTGDVTLNSSTAGNSQLRFIRVDNISIPNNFFLNPNANGNDIPTPATPAGRNADLVKEAQGTLTIDGLITAGDNSLILPNTQRALITVNSGKLILAGGIDDDATNKLQINNNSITEFAGASNLHFDGLINGGGTYILNLSTQAKTLTLTELATTNPPASIASTSSGVFYISKGTVVAANSGGSAINNDMDMYFAPGTTLTIDAVTGANDETIGLVGAARGSFIKLDHTGALRVDDANVGNAAGFINATISGTGGFTAASTGTVSIYSMDNSYAGTTSVANGVLQLRSLEDSGVNSSAGTGTDFNLGITAASVLEYIGATLAGHSTDRSVNLAGGSNGTLRANGYGPVVFAGAVSSTAGGSKTLILDGENLAANTISGIISNSSATTSVTKSGGGKWVLTGANSFTGSLSASQGTLEVNQINALGSLVGARTINVSAAASGLLVFNNPLAGAETIPSNITFNAATGAGAVAELRNDGASTIAIQGNLTAGTNNKTWTLSGGNTTVNTISGVISNGSGVTTSLTKAGLGTWRLNGANTFTGAVNINEGLLQIANVSGNTFQDAVDVNVNNSFGTGSTLELLTSETIDHLSGGVGSSVILTGGSLTIGAANGAATFNGVISGAGGITKNGTGAIGFGGQSQFLPNLGQNTYTGPTRINGGRIDTATLANGGVASGIGQATNAAANLVLAGTAADSGLRFIGTHAQSTDRLLTLGPVGALSSPTAIWADGTFVAGIQQSTIAFSDTGAIGFTGAGNRTLTLRGSSPIDNVFRPLIADNGAEVTSLQKVEQSIWVINNANTFTGPVSVNGGTLAAASGANGAFGDPDGGVTVTQPADNTRSFLDLRGVTVTGETLTLTGGANNNSFGVGASAGSNVWTGDVAVSQTALVPVFSGASLQFSGIISGASTLNKLGEGTLILSGNNTTTGAFLARGGTVELNYNTSSGSKLADGASLTLGAAAGGLAVQGTGAYNGSVNAMHTSGTTINLNGTTTDSGGVEIVSATTQDAGSSYVTRTAGTTILRLNLLSRNIGSTLDVAGANMVQVDNTNTNGIISGAVTFGKSGWAINGPNTGDGIVAPLATYTTNTWAAANNVDVTSSTSQSGQVNTLRFNTSAANTVTLTAAGIVNTGGVLLTANVGAFASTITGSTLTAGNANGGDFDIIVHQYNAAPLVIGSSLINNATNAAGLTISGSGPVVLTNNSNIRSGQTTINTGATLRVGNAGGAYGLPVVATGTLGGNASISTTYIGAIINNGSLIFDGAGPDVTLNGAINGNGTLELAASNTRTVILNNVGNNYYGDTIVNGGILAFGQTTVNTANNSGLSTVGLGSNIGRTVIGADGRVEFRIIPATNPQITRGAAVVPEYFSLNEGGEIAIPSTVTNASFPILYLTQPNVNLSHRLDLNNTTTAGGSIEVSGNNHLQIGGIVKGSNGFTKTGNGILTLSGTNWVDGAPTLSGQVVVAGGLLYVANNGRSLGATGAGNETIVLNGAALDLRDTDLNFGDDAAASREIIRISGSGLYGTGALRNTVGTGTLTFLELAADATIGGSARIDIQSADKSTLPGAIVPGVDYISPSVTGVGGVRNLDKVGVNDVSMRNATFGSLGTITIKEGELRMERDAPPLGTVGGANNSALKIADVAGVTVAYGGQTLSDPNNPASVLNPVVGARLEFFRQYDIHHTTPIILDGVTAAANKGTNFIDLNSDTGAGSALVRTYVDGGITLTGAASRNIFNMEGGSVSAVAAQGNQTVDVPAKLIVSGAITGTGGLTKVGSRELRLTADNTYSGDTIITRFTGVDRDFRTDTYQINGVDFTGLGTAESYREWNTTLTGANGALSGTGNIILERQGFLVLDNTNTLDATSLVTTTNNDNRINDAANLVMRGGMLRIYGGDAVVNMEAIAAVPGATLQSLSGTNMIQLSPTDGADMNMTLTIGEIVRSSGSVLRFQDFDATSTFSTSSTGDSVRVALTSIGTLTEVGAGTGATDKKIVVGLLGGVAPHPEDQDLRFVDIGTQDRNRQSFTGSHFMTYDGGYLRPLDDSEYATPTGTFDSSLAGKNVAITVDPYTAMLQSVSVNSLRFGTLSDSNGSGTAINDQTTLTGYTNNTQAALTIQDNAVLTIASGMISSASFGVGNNNVSTILQGGTINFGTLEGIINNQNGYIRISDGIYAGNNFEIRSVLAGSGGITKTGFQSVVLDAASTYTGLTTVTEGVLFARNGKAAFGAGGTGNGLVLRGSGDIRGTNGVTIGTAAAPEDLLVGIINGDQQILRSEAGVTNYIGDITLDNIDSAGIALFRPRLTANTNAALIVNGDIFGGNTLLTEDTLYTDPRILGVSSGNGYVVFRGMIGDKSDGSGNAIPVASVVNAFPTTAASTNENQVFRLQLTASDEANFTFDKQYNAAGRLSLDRGVMRVNYNPAAAVDGTGFWTNTAIARINNGDANANSFTGFSIAQNFGDAGGASTQALFLTRPNQVFNMAQWTVTSGSTGFAVVGGENQTGTVTYGTGNGNLVLQKETTLYGMDGGTVNIAHRLTGGTVLKTGLGTVVIQGSNSTTASDTATVTLAGGTLKLDYGTFGSTAALVGNQNIVFRGGVLQSVRSTGTGTVTTRLATDNAAARVVTFAAGGNEIIAEARSGNDMTILLGNANANNTTANLVRSAGATANFVSWSNGGGAAEIDMDFNVSSSAAAVKNQLIGWATFGTSPRNATDFAMVDGGASNQVKAYARTAAEEQNDVTLWSTISVGAAGPNVSETGGSGFRGTLVTETVNSVHFDAQADSRIDISGTLTVTNGGIMVSSAAGYANKSISGGNITAGAGAGAELIVHQYGLGNLTIDSDISGPSSLTITGPSTTNAANFNTTGAVVLVGSNLYTGKTTINGSVLSIATESSLGAVPTNLVTDQLTLDGGTLRFTGTNERLSENRGVTILGNGGVIEVVNPNSNLFIRTQIASEGNFRGDLIKTGAGSLTLEGDASANQSGFRGLIDVREGTLRIAGQDSTLNNNTTVKTMFGSSFSAADGTILRSGTDLVIQMGFGNNNTNNTIDWLFEEFFTFEGNNLISVGQTGIQYLRLTDQSLQTANKPVNLNGPIQINGTVSIDTVNGQTVRLNNGGGYLAGSGGIIKEGNGTLEFRENSPDWTGALTVNQGRVLAANQGTPLGTGTGTITIGSNEQAGVSELLIHSDLSVAGAVYEVNQNISVTYNPAQTKRLGVTNQQGNGGQDHYFNGDITLNDNLVLYYEEGDNTFPVGGEFVHINYNGRFKDGALTSGNLVADSAVGGANNATNGRAFVYHKFNADNSLWTGDLVISGNTSYDQDDTVIVRAGHANALTQVNDVTLNYNSVLQTGGFNIAVGSLETRGGNGQLYGEGLVSDNVNGSTEIIENAASTPGTLTINQTTPVTSEVSWDAKFRDGTLPSHWFVQGTTETGASLSIVKAGSGWATLTLDNDYTGTTIVTGGILQVGRNSVGDTGSPTAAGLTVNSGATLAGTGIVQGSTLIQTGASLKPGDDAGTSIGTLTLAGDTTLQTNSITTLQVLRSSYTNVGHVGYTSGANYTTWLNGIPTDIYSGALSDSVLSNQHDMVNVLGTLTWAANTKVVLTNNGYNPTAGDIFDLFDWFSVVGSINVGTSLRTGAETGTDLDLFELGGDFRWDTSLFNSQGILVVTLPGLVPEPGRLMFLFIGLAGALLRRRRH